MSDIFSAMAERQIQKALADNKLSGLMGEGQPLPHRPDETAVDAGTAAGYRMMRDHGALPEEVVLRQALVAAKAAYAGAGSDTDKRAAMARIAEVQMKLAMASEARTQTIR